MIPPHIYYRQQQANRLMHDPQISFVSSDSLIFELQETHLKITWQNGATRFLAYSAIENVRLDYKRKGRKHNRRRKFYCILNENITIRSKSCYSCFWEYESDEFYNLFIRNLHTKLIQNNQCHRVYKTNLNGDDFRSLLVFVSFIWIIALFWGIYAISSHFQMLLPPLFVFIAGGHTLSKNTPSSYSPEAIPSDFLS